MKKQLRNIGIIAAGLMGFGTGLPSAASLAQVAPVQIATQNPSTPTPPAPVSEKVNTPVATPRPVSQRKAADFTRLTRHTITPAKNQRQYRKKWRSNPNAPKGRGMR